MSNDVESKPSEGRFIRIEAAIDKLVDDVAEFRVDVATRLTRLETVAVTADKVQVTKVSDRTYFWMRVGIVASIFIGIGSFVASIYLG